MLDKHAVSEFFNNTFVFIEACVTYLIERIDKIPRGNKICSRRGHLVIIRMLPRHCARTIEKHLATDRLNSILFSFGQSHVSLSIGFFL